MDRTRYTNSMACSFPWFKSLRFLLLVTSEVYGLCYKSQWHPKLAITNTKWIWDNLYNTWNSPVSLALTVQASNILHWSSSWTFWATSLIVRRP
jgi:hypothetical protein